MTKQKKIIAIIQTGKTIQSAWDKFGDFDQWFIRAMSIDKENTKTYKVFEKLEFPDKNNLAGVIITGSAAMVTDELEWSEKTISWLKKIIDLDIPVLGVCYGHQLLAKLLGGQVAWNPKGRQIGMVDVKFTRYALKDALFEPLLKASSGTLKFIATHQQSVVKIPNNVTLLATTELDPIHCFRYKDHVWGTQFHPEFNIAMIKEYINDRSTDLINEGLNAGEIIQALKENDNGEKLLQRFKAICFP